MSKATNWGLCSRKGVRSVGWRATLSSPMFKTRKFGNRRETITEAVEDFLTRLPGLFVESSMNVLRQQAQALQVRMGRQLPSGGGHPMHPNVLPVAVSQAPAKTSRQAATEAPSLHRRSVQYVHQIYGIFGDGKPMSSRFASSRHAWGMCAVSMGATHILWDASQVETLIRTRYSTIWDMYQQVRYPVMRVDIARIVILHAYGGLYADLDTLPNRQWYSEAPLAVCSVYGPTTGGGRHDSDWREGTGPGGCQPRTEFLDMEVLVGEKGSPFFLKWLEHIRKEISEKNYKDQRSFWHNAKMRYIYNTTGPVSMRRFLKLPENASLQRRMLRLKMNWFKDEPKLTPSDRRHFDAITVESNTYFTDRHEIRVPVGTDDVDLPAEPTRLRTCGKSPVHRSKRPDKVAPDPRQLASIEDFAQEYDRQAQYIDRVREFYQKYARCVAVTQMLQEMPDDLRRWIMQHEQRHCRGETSVAKRSPQRPFISAATPQTSSQTAGCSSTQQRGRSRTPPNRRRA